MGKDVSKKTLSETIIIPRAPGFVKRRRGFAAEFFARVSRGVRPFPHAAEHATNWENNVTLGAILDALSMVQ